MNDTCERVALYFAPADDSPLAHFGHSVLGRTACQPRQSSASGNHPDRQRWLALTSAPAHYGFHATLKAPFTLAEDRSLADLNEALGLFAASRPALSLEGLAPRHMADFAALTLARQLPVLDALAFEIVTHFDHFRRPLTDADRQRRLQQDLSERQRALLERYGYPHVDDEFRFHMTLSGRLGAQDSDYLCWLQQQYHEQVHETPRLDRLAIYAQPDRQSPFVRVFSHALTG